MLSADSDGSSSENVLDIADDEVHPKEDIGKVPWKRLTPIYSCIGAQGMSVNLIVPFVVEMCQTRFGVASEDLGTMSSLLVGSFTLTTFFANLFLGYVSDRVGRRPMVAVGLVFSALSILMFGLAETFFVALVARILGGAFNANQAVLKAALSDVVVDHLPSVRARAFGFMGAAFAASRAIASALAGVLAGPLLPFWPFTDNDFLLPCLVGVLVNIACLGLVYRFFKETNPFARSASATERKESGEATQPLVNEGEESDMSGDDGPDEQGFKLKDSTAVKGGPVSPENLGPFGSFKAGLLEIWRQPVLLRVVFCFFLHSMLNGGLLFGFILLYSLPLEDGGLGFSPQENGIALFVFGGVSVAFQLFVFKKVATSFSLTRIYLAGVGLLVVGSLLIPLPILFADSPGAKWTLVTVVCGGFLATGFMSGLPVLNTILANCSDKRRYGLTQGVAASIANFGRSLGPLLLGFLVSGFSALKSPWLITVLLGLGYLCLLATMVRIRANPAWCAMADGISDQEAEIALEEVGQSSTSEEDDGL